MNNKILKRKLVYIAIAILFMIAIFTIASNAQETQGLELSFDEASEEYTVVGIGDYTDAELIIPSSYNGYPVTKIGEKAFYNNTEITELVIPDSVTEIGDFSFHYCISLKTVHVGNGVKTIGKNSFYFCTALKELDLGNSVAEILDYAFYNCSALNFLTIPNSTTYIGDNAFKYCYNILRIVLGSGVETIEIDSFDLCYKITEIYNLSKLEIVAGENDNGGIATKAKIVHTSIDDESILIFEENGYVFCYFDNTYYLVNQIGTEKSLTLPKTINNSTYEIGRYAFIYRTDLEKVTISDGVTKIGDSAFYFCGSLKGITIPDSVVSLGKLVFSDCHSLTYAHMSDNVIETGAGLFQDCYVLNNVTLSDNIKEMGQAFFYGCKNLVNIQLPSKLEKIDLGAFYNCEKLAGIIIPSKVIYIGGSVFYNCKALKKVIIPKNVTEIGSYAFYGCDVAKLYCWASSAMDGWDENWNASNRPVTWDYTIMLEDVFVFKGYSTDGKSICAGYVVNEELLDEYSQTTENTWSCGIVLASYEQLNGNNPLDENCNPLNNTVVSFGLTCENQYSYDIILNDVIEEYYRHPFVLTIYTCENQEVKYIQGEARSDVAGISCKELLESDVDAGIGSMEL